MDVGGARSAARAAATRWRAHIKERTEPSRRCLVAASFTSHQLQAGLGISLLDAGIDAVISFTDSNQIFQVCLQPEDSGVDRADDLVILWRIEDLFEPALHAWANGDDRALDRLIEGASSLGAAVRALAARQLCVITVSDAPIPVGFGFDHADTAELNALMQMAQRVNDAFTAALGDHPSVERYHLSSMQFAFGTLATFDQRGWLMYRQPFPDWASYLVGSQVGAVIAARTRVAPKVLVLDCDGTLWDGVAADDGIGGLDASDAFPGRAFQEFQRAVQRLRHRGVLLALSSKNDPSTVTEAFARVDGMVLVDDDIAARRVSWNPKPGEISDIVAELNVGIDAVVFVDDSPYEIGAVSTQLPAVRCFQVPDDVEQLPDLLAESGLFRLMRTTGDDRDRTARIRAEIERSAAAPTMTHDEFLASSELRVTLLSVGSDELGRTAQLVNKTNQFNLTTRRRDAAAVAQLIVDPDVEVLAVDVADRFGEYGMVGVVIARWDGRPGHAAWTLDTVLMSCRVLGRGVETAMLALVVRHLRNRHDGDVVGEYMPTNRNDRVSELFTAHGFVTDVVTGIPQGPGARFRLHRDADIEAPAHIVARDVAGTIVS